MMKVGVIGYGYVGRHTHTALADMGYGIEIFDPASHPRRLTGLDAAIICVPTPMADDGSCDTSIVERAAKEADAPIIVVRSTVEPGTCDRITAETGKQVVFLPEFVVARTGDDAGGKFWIIGGDCPDGLLPERDAMARLTLREAETVKYLLNCYFAAKVVFAYEFASVCERAGISYANALEAAALDSRFDADHMHIIENPGAGGPCLPKDLSAFIEFGKGLGLDMPVLSTIRAENNRLLGQ